jgi:hypothetical protein
MSSEHFWRLMLVTLEKSGKGRYVMELKMERCFPDFLKNYPRLVKMHEFLGPHGLFRHV